MGDEKMDFFVFFGEPKDILNEYTEITGKSPMLPLWTFGTWMSRITYFSQKEGLDIAANLRKYKIPADVSISTLDGLVWIGNATISLPPTDLKIPWQ